MDSRRTGDDPGRLLTVPEACGRLRVGRSTLYDLVAAGRLPAYRVGLGRGKVLISERDLSSFLADCRVDPAGSAPKPAPAPRATKGGARARPIRDHFN